MSWSIKKWFPSQSRDINKLFELRENKNNDEQTLEKIQIIVKSINIENKNSSNDLIKVLKYPGKNNNCIVIDKIDNLTSQFDEKYIHVIASQIWRWPELQLQSELKPLDICQYSHKNVNNTKICINPYHWNKIKIPPIMVPVHQYDTDVENNITLNALNVNESTLTNDNYMNYKYNKTEQSYTSLNNLTINDNNKTISTTSIVDKYYSSSNFDTDSLILPDGYLSFNSDYTPSEFLSSSSTTSIDTINKKNNYQKISPVVYEELDNWADIAYYEYNTRVGDVHHSHSQCIIIDGFSNPLDNTSRFSIGKLINPSRHPLSESIRKHIGKGLHLHYMGGEIWAECHSLSSIFIQSVSLNNSANFYDNTVIKISPGQAVMIFNFEEFSSLISQRVNRGYEAVHELTKMCVMR